MKNILFLGDSHIRVFEKVKERNLIPNANLFIGFVVGATALGMVNPHSKTNALNTFSKILSNTKGKMDTVVFLLGEVDCGFVIWYRAKKHGISVQDQVNESVYNYCEFLLELNNAGYKDIVVLAPPPPTIEDNQKWGEVANLRSVVNTTIRERTELTRLYIESIKNFCHLYGFTFIDTFTPFIEEKTKLIDKTFKNKNPLDHHLDRGKAAEVYAEKIDDYLNSK